MTEPKETPMTTDLELQLGQRAGTHGPVWTLTINGTGPFDADSAIAQYRAKGRLDVAAHLERFLADETEGAIYPRAKAAPEPEPAPVVTEDPRAGLHRLASDERHAKLVARASELRASKVTEVVYDDDDRVLGDVTYDRP